MKDKEDSWRRMGVSVCACVSGKQKRGDTKVGARPIDGAHDTYAYRAVLDPFREAAS